MTSSRVALRAGDCFAQGIQALQRRYGRFPVGSGKAQNHCLQSDQGRAMQRHSPGLPTPYMQHHISGTGERATQIVRHRIVRHQHGR